MAGKSSITLTAERLRELLDYDPATGVFRWRVTRGGIARARRVAGSNKEGGRVVISVDDKKYDASRLAWLYVYSSWPLGQLDHEDLVRNHNWINNLRLATKSQNAANTGRRVDNTSGFKGVSRRRGKWCAKIWHHGRCIWLGDFEMAEDAHAAYVAAAKKLFGPFANGG